MLLTVEERKAALETVLDEVGDRAGVIAHIGAFQTPDTMVLARHACEAGADAIAAIPPAYFFLPDELGIIQYYTALSELSSVPVLAYNIPHRTGVKMTVEQLDQLLELPNIVGMKESYARMLAYCVIPAILIMIAGTLMVIFSKELSFMTLL